MSSWFIKKFPKSATVGESVFLDDGTEVEREGVVHRLDKDTSGVLLLAKTTEGFELLKDQFQNRKIKKIYIAFVVGEMKQERLLITKPIGQSVGDFRKKTSRKNIRGEAKEATTLVRTIKNLEGNACVWVAPKTGRTHQIRVHLLSVHHPIIADRLYGKVANKLGFKRVALHARAISFMNCGGKEIRVLAPFPSDFEEAISIFGIQNNQLLK